MAQMKYYFSRLGEIFAAIISYMFFHEVGHFLFATALGLDPSFVVTEQSGIAGFTMAAIGVSAGSTTLIAHVFSLLGATILPLMVAISMFAYGLKTENNTFVNIAEVYLILIMINLIPFRGLEGSDGNMLWKVFS
jgi:hypothetical protein